MTVQRSEILSSLRLVREDVERQIAELDRFRALKAIEQTMAEFAGLVDFTSSLADIRDHTQRQLEDTREYRALRTIERMMPELSEVLALLHGAAEKTGPQQNHDEAEALADDQSDTSAAALLETAPTIELRQTEAVEFAAAAEPFAAAIPTGDGMSEAETPHGPVDDARQLATEAEEQTEASAPVPSLADSVAQLMAQSIPPPAREAYTAAAPDERGGTAPPQAERAA
ncbi:MAG: hypothetical protein AB7V13_19365 [Pseudorhodoplanes sp.]|uniref:hypothetical protein n=1 Tax=Pseudorhodoplanes sp. TaxID=1934341 RepID=UPI003D0B9936